MEKNYDVIITIPNIKAENKEEAEYKAREKAKIRDRGYVDIKEIKD